MSDALLLAGFLVAAAVSLATSWLLVTRLERVGKRLGLSEALLGMLAALAADAPEVTSAVTALAGHQARIGAGVVIGSNVFNLAALLGLAAVAGGRIELHRRVIALEGTVAVLIAVLCLIVVVGAVPAAAGLGGVLAVMIPYLALLGGGRERLLRRLKVSPRWVEWLALAVVQEERELEPAIHPHPARRVDELVAAAAVVIVVGASIAMEQAASRLGTSHHVAEIIVGGLVLAGVTSLPNAVAGLYLAARGRGAATLSTALNSNALNVCVGLLLPATIVGLGAPSGQASLIAAWYLGLTVVSLAFARRDHGLRRGPGAVIIAAYVAFAAVVVTVAT